MNVLAISTLLALQPDDALLFTVLGAGALGVGTLTMIALARNFLHLCRTNEVLIFTGRAGGPLVVRSRTIAGEDDTDPGGGRGRKWRIPVIERVDRMETTTMSVDVVVQNAYSAGNIPLRIHAIANVKIQTHPRMLRNAIERFLGRSADEIRLVAQQTLEGSLREVLAQMTPEQVNEDRLAFADNLAKSARDDFDKLGLQLDTLKIQNVSDETGYLDSLGRPAIAHALRDAENAENQAMQEITEAQALANQRSEVARAAAQTTILQKKNDLARIRAELDGAAAAVEREAEAAAKTARARAELELQLVRAELEQKRLLADVVIPAEMQRQAAAILAKGDAAPTTEQGRAVAQVLEATATAWRSLGPQARDIWVIQHLEEIVGTLAARVAKIHAGEVHVVDPGDGSGLAAYAAAYPQTLAAVLRAVRDTTGVDVTAILAAEGGAAPPRPPGPAAPALGRSVP
jgi:flotillin